MLKVVVPVAHAMELLRNMNLQGSSAADGADTEPQLLEVDKPSRRSTSRAAFWPQPRSQTIAPRLPDSTA